MSDTRAPFTLHHALIALLCCLILAISNGLTISNMTVIRASMSAEYGWTAQQMGLADLITFLSLGVFAPFVGILIDRFGTRTLLIIGGLVLALSYAAYSKVTTLGQVYGVHLLFAVVLALCGLVPVVALVSRWFTAKRATAIGFALVGTSLGGVILPKLTVPLVAEHGWRGVFLIEASFGLLLSVLVFLLVRSAPAERGVRAYGDEGLAARDASDLPGLDFTNALGSVTFWCLCIGAAMTFFAMLGTLLHAFKFMSDLGFAPPQAVSGIGVMLTAALIGKFGFGLLADLLRPKTVYLLNTVLMGAGAALLARANPGSVFIAWAVFGLGWGGLYTMLQLMCVQCFGLRSAGKIMGAVAIADCEGGGFGSFVMGAVRTHTGSYQNGFWLMAALIAVAFVAATQVRQVYQGAGAARI